MESGCKPCNLPKFLSRADQGHTHSYYNDQIDRVHGHGGHRGEDSLPFILIIDGQPCSMCALTIHENSRNKCLDMYISSHILIVWYAPLLVLLLEVTASARYFCKEFFDVLFLFLDFKAIKILAPQTLKLAL